MRLPDAIQRKLSSLQDNVLIHRIGLLVIFGSLFLAGTALCFLASSPYGIGVTHDSVFYLTAAGNFIAGRGLSWFANGGELRPLTHFAPLYPLTLSLFVNLGLSPDVAARWIAAFAFGANVTLIGTLTMHYSRRLWAALLASGLALLSAVILGVHVIALSEPFYIFFMLACLFLLAKFIENPSNLSLVFSAMLAGFSYLARYVGVVVLGTGILSLLILGERKIIKRLRDALLFGVLAFAPISIWMARNFYLTGTATNRTFRFHPPRPVLLEKLADTIVRWVSPFDLPSTWNLVLLLILLVIIVAGFWHICRRRESSLQPACNFMILLALFCILYVSSLLVSITFFDASTPIDNRILSPIYVVTLVLTILIGSHVQLRGRLAPIGVLLLIVVYGVASWNQGVDSYHTLRSLFESGIGFSSVTWQSSQTIAWVEMLPGDSRIYTNERLALTYLTGKSAYSVPEKFDSVKAQVRSEFEREFETMHANLKEPDSYLVLFNPYHLRWGLPTRDEITFPLSALERFDDAVIYINPVNLK